MNLVSYQISRISKHKPNSTYQHLGPNKMLEYKGFSHHPTTNTNNPTTKFNQTIKSQPQPYASYSKTYTCQSIRSQSYPLTSLSNNNLTSHYSITLTYHTTDLKAKSKLEQHLLHIHLSYLHIYPFSPLVQQFLAITKSGTSQTKI